MKNQKLCAFAVLPLMVASGLWVIPQGEAAVSVPTPSVPEFTVEQVDRSYDAPPTSVTTVDPLTGEEKTTQTDGGRISNLTMDITIKNQPYQPLDWGNGSVVELYYSVQGKGHFSSWENASVNGDYVYYTPIVASAGEYTVYTVVLDNTPWHIEGTGQVDFEVKALAGYNYQELMALGMIEQRFASVSESNWSSTQTVTVGVAPTPQSNPFSVFESLQLEHAAIVVMAAAIAVLIVLVVLLWRRIPKRTA